MSQYAPPTYDRSTAKQATNVFSTIAKALLLAAFLMLLIPMGLMLVLFFLMGREYDAVQEEGPAPVGSVAERRAWGEERLNDFFDRADKWAKKSSQIRGDIGRVIDVAPIGSPNSYGSSFGEAWASLNLQVIGTKGEGVLFLPEAVPDENAAWIFDGIEHPVFENGKSWLVNNQLQSEFQLVLDLAEKQDHRGVISACEQLKHAVDKKMAAKTTRGGQLFSSFPKTDRNKILMAFAVSLDATNNPRNEMGLKAAEVCQEAAEQLLDDLSKQQWNRSWAERLRSDDLRISNDLKQASEFLRIAIQAHPENEHLLRLAGIRVLLAYRHQTGCFFDDRYQVEKDERRQRIRNQRQAMFAHAEKIVERSAYLQSELGEIKVEPVIGYVRLPKTLEQEILEGFLDFPIAVKKQGLVNSPDYWGLRIGRDGRFAAYIAVELVGENGKRGTLKAFVQEPDSQAHQRDLFAETIVGPTERLEHSHISWREAGKRGSVRLSSVTLNPVPKKKRTQK